MLPVANERLLKREQSRSERINNRKFRTADPDSAHMDFSTPTCELKFFKMLSVLAKNNKENIYILRGMKRVLSDYANSLKQEQARVKHKILHILKFVESYEDY